ncbi:MerR family transcriptional regulator [Ferruginibacter sp.]|uniref:MerR family transcriptional regulator n=1 Tax=Ferruginibacter sp. TaxID=1940288 RepID=UPI001987BBA2|nr:MerR family transcriptional regulator [Ferruginibacter sp.]MBC7627756.1 MerR family transcriptional regulator [Ferruginibacter sp.]
MNTFTIKDLENLSGIKAHTIRIWEQRYNFLKPSRSDTNIRYYSNDELKKVLNIALLNKYGYKISHIDKMGESELREKILTLTQTEAQQERIVNDLIQCMVDLDIERLENVLDSHIRVRGIERTITQIIFPYMEKIGILWLTNHINPAQEHLVSNVIRQKLIVGIEGIVTSLKINKTVLLFLPEGEYHELGMLFMYYLLKSRGVSTIYLGANVPMQDVEYVVNLKKPDYLYSHLTSVGHNFNFDKFISAITKKFNGTPIIISGLLTNSYEKKIPAHINFKKSFPEVMEFVATI